MQSLATRHSEVHGQWEAHGDERKVPGAAGAPGPVHAVPVPWLANENLPQCEQRGVSLAEALSPLL